MNACSQQIDPEVHRVFILEKCDTERFLFVNVVFFLISSLGLRRSIWKRLELVLVIFSCKAAYVTRTESLSDDQSLSSIIWDNSKRQTRWKYDSNATDPRNSSAFEQFFYKLSLFFLAFYWFFSHCGALRFVWVSSIFLWCCVLKFSSVSSLLPLFFSNNVEFISISTLSHLRFCCHLNIISFILQVAKVVVNLRSFCYTFFYLFFMYYMFSIYLFRLVFEGVFTCNSMSIFGFFM